jgi:hypothetical protein
MRHYIHAASIERKNRAFSSALKFIGIAVNYGIFLGIPALYVGGFAVVSLHYHYYWFRLKNFKTNIFYYQ